MQKLNLVEAETLLYEPLEKPSFVVCVDELIIKFAHAKTVKLKIRR